MLILKKYFLLFISLIIFAYSMLFGSDLTIQCSDGVLTGVDHKIKSLLPGLFLDQQSTSDITFPQQYRKDNIIYQNSLQQTVQLIKQLICYATNVTDDKRMKLVNESSCQDLLILYINYNFLGADQKILNLIQEAFLYKFITETRQQNNHWIFIFSRINDKTELSERSLILYWKEKITAYLSNNTFYTPDLVIKQLTKLIPIHYHDELQIYTTGFCTAYYYDKYEANFCQRYTFNMHNQTLNLTGYKLDDTIVYNKNAYWTFPKHKSIFNDDFFDFFLTTYKFKIKKIILDNNNIRRLPISEFIKCFPNLQCISVKKCPINKGILECNTDVYFCNREDFVCSGNIVQYESIRNTKKIMWNGMGFPSEQYDQTNNDNPLTIIYDNSNKKYFDQYKNYYTLPNIKFINADTPNNDVPQKDNLFTIIKKKVFFTIILTKIICNQIARKLISYLYFLK